jgi:hypothetical protein
VAANCNVPPTAIDWVDELTAIEESVAVVIVVAEWVPHPTKPRRIDIDANPASTRLAVRCRLPDTRNGFFTKSSR